MTGALVKKLEQSLQRGSLNDIVTARKKKVEDEQKKKERFLLLDCSGSMGESIENGRAKIDALREIVKSLQAKTTFTTVIFPAQTGAMISDEIPGAGGNTPLHSALELTMKYPVRHIVIVSDGMPDDSQAALSLARDLKGRGVKIDVFYVGPRPHPGEDFLRQLSAETGGQFESTSLGHNDREMIASIERKMLAWR